MDIRGKTIVLTGASSGIGKCAAMQLAKAGARLCLLARREDELMRVKADIEANGGLVWIYPVDLSDASALETCAEKILHDHARIDVLVNNAARSIRRPIEESLDRMHDYERTMQLNYFAALRLTMKLLPRFLAQESGQVINISSMSTQIPIPLFSAYLASKSALESFSRSLAVEVGHKGIAVTTIYFPMVRTPMSSRTTIYKHMRMMNMEEAAGWIVQAVEKRPARIASPVGTIGNVILSALPSQMIRLTRPLFRRMDERLQQRLQQDGK